MAAIDYPATLPKVAPVGGRPDSGVIRTNMDVGPAKVRRRSTATAKPMGFTFRTTGAKFDTFKTFFHDTSKEGSLAFDMEDPWDDTTQEWRFVGTYDWRLVAGASNPDDRIYEITVQMEKLP